MTERRYDEEETAAIFARASETSPREASTLPAKQGWSLAELQAIGREAGLAPEEAVRALPVELLRGLSDAYLQTLSPETQAAIRVRRGT